MIQPAIQGVSPGGTAFVGPTDSGTLKDVGRPVYNYSQYIQRFGRKAATGSKKTVSETDYMSQAAKVFFNNGGRVLYVASVTQTKSDAYKKALNALVKIPGVGLVAAPGSSALAVKQAREIARLLTSHAERMRYRFALLDAPPNLSEKQLAEIRRGIDSSYAAIYAPWVKVRDENTSRTVLLPPSGFIAGIITNVDRMQGVEKAPANEPLQGALGLEREISPIEQQLLTPSGINFLRVIPGAGVRVWGARTVSSDPKWKYINVRRYLMYLEKSIIDGTRWVASVANDNNLSKKVENTIQAFLNKEWRKGALKGRNATEAYFVRCADRLMNTTEITNGRVVCDIGVAPLKPAEFVIFHVSQN